MRLHGYRKLIPIDALRDLGDAYRREGRTVVHCHGCFDIVHPGHVRYLRSAGQHGDVLIVSLTGDDAIEKDDGARPYIPQELRAENLAAFEFVDHVVIAPGPTAEPIIEALRPHLYVKGKEYEGSHHPGFLREQAMVEHFGGRVMFSSGDVVFSSSTIVESLNASLRRDGYDQATGLSATCRRWNLSHPTAAGLLRDMRDRRVLVVGDSICDRYVFCDTSDVANEAPILSVRPTRETSYPGGAAVIAAHLRAMGARPHLVTTTADDEASAELLASLDGMRIEHTTLPIRSALPLKQRYLVETQKLLKVDRGDASVLDSAAERRLLAAVADLRTQLDAAIFVDFGYGTLSIPLLGELLGMLRPHVGTIAGDVSGPRRTLLAMHGADLLTPTERELRGIAGDFEQSLPTVALETMRQLHVANLIVTMGAKGCVLFHPRESERANWFESRLRSEHVPSLGGQAVDVVGAGDALLSAAALAMTSGATVQQAGYLGSAAAAVAMSRLGNLPVSSTDLSHWLEARPELRAVTPTTAAG